jgi:hypothetical protein
LADICQGRAAEFFRKLGNMLRNITSKMLRN